MVGGRILGGNTVWRTATKPPGAKRQRPSTLRSAQGKTDEGGIERIADAPSVAHQVILAAAIAQAEPPATPSNQLPIPYDRDSNGGCSKVLP
jgi:hypothetical protein